MINHCFPYPSNHQYWGWSLGGKKIFVMCIFPPFSVTYAHLVTCKTPHYIMPPNPILTALQAIS